ncbi:hypothetical protein NM688_g6546 [Phlebia brevispora]|uniref:Uncharacterized protein n=1 Tax=Phlebia brevispora TaxID=194682 RepID=A0ACC1SEY5_9APHY|nr:hypothetical protein NM688_g6546 [Phlebia brevispora]
MLSANSTLSAVYGADLILNYCIFAAFAFVCYELAITFEYEYEFLWRRRRTVATWLFIANRYSMLASVIVMIIPMHAKVSRQEISKTLNSRKLYLQTCPKSWTFFLNFIFKLPIFMSAAFSALKVFALLDHAYITASSYASMSPVMLLMRIWPTPYSGHRVAMQTMPRPPRWQSINLAAALTTILADVVAIAATWFKMYRHARQAAFTGIGIGFGAILLQYGTMYFLVLSVVNLADLILSLTLPTQLTNPTSIFTSIVPNVVLSRFIINLRQISSEGPSHLTRFSRFSPVNFRVPTLPSPTVVDNFYVPVAKNEDSLVGHEAGGDLGVCESCSSREQIQGRSAGTPGTLHTGGEMVDGIAGNWHNQEPPIVLPMRAHVHQSILSELSSGCLEYRFKTGIAPKVLVTCLVLPGAIGPGLARGIAPDIAARYPAQTNLSMTTIMHETGGKRRELSDRAHAIFRVISVELTTHLCSRNCYHPFHFGLLQVAPRYGTQQASTPGMHAQDQPVSLLIAGSRPSPRGRLSRGRKMESYRTSWEGNPQAATVVVFQGSRETSFEKGRYDAYLCPSSMQKDPSTRDRMAAELSMATDCETVPMSTSTSDAALIAAYKTYVNMNYCGYAATAFVCYEFVITFRYEHEFLWRRKWTAATWLFMVNRCYNSSLLYFVTFAFNVPMCLLAIFSALRVFVLLDFAYFTGGFVLLLGLVPVAMNFYQESLITYIYADYPVLGPGCYTNDVVSPALAYAQASVAGLGAGFGGTLFRYGTLYFVALCAVDIVDLIVFLVPSIQLIGNPMTIFTAMVPSVMLSRFLINLREVDAATPSDNSRPSRFSEPNFRRSTLNSIVGNLGEQLADGDDTPDHDEDRDDAGRWEGLPEGVPSE